jgi:hypothetical protein
MMTYQIMRLLVREEHLGAYDITKQSERWNILGFNDIG